MIWSLFGAPEIIGIIGKNIHNAKTIDTINSTSSD